MDLSRLKKVFAGVSVAAISLTQAGSVFAAYNDVPAGVWFEDAVDAFVDLGYLDASQARFRGGDNANRAEFVKLVVELAGGILSTPPAVPSFDDVPTGAWYYGYFEEAGKEGWVKGDGNCYSSHPCYARPGANINRAEAAALIVRAFGLEATGDAATFVDNPDGQWYTDVIQTAADSCVLQGDGGTGRVRPGDNMNRAEMVVMLNRVDQDLTFGVDCGGGDVTADPVITDIVGTSSTTVEVEFSRPLDQATAEDAGNYGVSPDLGVDSVTLVDSDLVEVTLGGPMSAGDSYTLSVDGILTTGGDTVTDAMTFVGYSAIVPGDGILELSVAAVSPAGDTVPKGAIGVTMVSVDFTASCDDEIQIDNVTILHEGRGAVADIGGLYAAIDGARVTRKRTIDSEDQTADLRFSSPLVLDRCETVTVDIVADFASTATVSGEHNLVVELPSDVTSNAKEVDGNFPVRGDMFEIAAITSGTVSVAYRTVSPDEVEVGDTGVVIGKFEVATNSTEDQTFYSATFEQNSSASDGDFTNLAIRRSDGTVLTNTVSQTVGDFVTLVFDPPFTVLEGDKITLEIIADIEGGASDTIIMHFEETSDLFAVGSLYGYGVNGQLYGSQVTLPTETAGLPDTITIDAGEFTLGIDGPSQQDYTRDSNDAILANIEMRTGGEKVDVKDLFVLILGQETDGTSIGTALSGILEDVEIRNTTTGRTIDGVRLTTTAASGTGASSTVGQFQIYRFDDFIVSGEENWEFRVDFIDNGATKHPLNGDKFKIYICGEPTHLSTGANATGCSFGSVITTATAYQMDIEGLSTGDRVHDVRPRGSIAGNFHSISAASLAIDVQTLNTSDSAVHNAEDINLIRFEARAGEAENVLLTKLIFEAALGSLANDLQDFALWVDTDGDRVVDTVLESGVAAQSSQVSFSEMEGGGYVIPAESTIVFEVHADIASYPSNSLVQARFDTGSSVTYVEAEELDDGSSLSGIKTNGTCASTCDITVTTTASSEWTLVSQGDLYVTKDSTSTGNRQFLGGDLGKSALRLQFRANNEDIDVTDIRLTSSGGVANEVDVLELYKDDESTPFVLATRNCPTNALTTNPAGHGTVKSFCADMEDGQLIVPEGENVDVVIRPRMKSDVNGGASNAVIQFLVNEHESVTDNSSGAILARGYESSNDLSASNHDATEDGEVFIGINSAAANNTRILGSEHVSVLAQITSIANANPDANGSAINTGLLPFGQFSFTAADNANSWAGYNDAVLSGLLFNVNATNVEMTYNAFKIYEKGVTASKKTCTAYRASDATPLANAASGALLIDCNGLVADAVNTEIDPGETLTLVLEGDVVRTNITANATSTLQAQLQNFNLKARTTYGESATDTKSHIQWLDQDDGVDGTFTWVEYPDSAVGSTSYRS